MSAVSACQCGHLCRSTTVINQDTDSYSFNCDVCGTMFLSRPGVSDVEAQKFGQAKQTHVLHPIEIANLKNGDAVMNIDNKHPLFLQTGFVTNLSHKFVRVLFKDDVIVWLPSSVVAKIPDNFQ